MRAFTMAEITGTLFSGGDVTVRYVDQYGSKLADTELLQGNIGEMITVETKDIDRHVLNQTVYESGTNAFTANPQIVTLVYKKTMGPVAGDVVIHYVDEDGHKISESHVLHGHLGEMYATVDKTIEGHMFKSVSGNATGTYTKEKQAVFYVYKAEK